MSWNKITIIFLGLAIATVVLAWSHEDLQPLDISSNPQVKSGPLALEKIFYTDKLETGVLFSTTRSSSFNLPDSYSFVLNDGTQGAGYILTSSDGEGRTSWKDPLNLLTEEGISVNGDMWRRDGQGRVFLNNAVNIKFLTIGRDNVLSSGENGVAIGRGSTQGAFLEARAGSVAVGFTSNQSSSASGRGSAIFVRTCGLNQQAMASGDYSVVVGCGRASGLYSLSILSPSTILGRSSVALINSRSQGLYSFSAVYGDAYNFSYATSIGQWSHNDADYATSIGFGRAQASHRLSAIGRYSTAIGYAPQLTSGLGARAIGESSVIVTSGAQIPANHRFTAEGNFSTVVNYGWSVGVGSSAISADLAQGDFSTALAGSNNLASKTGSFAVGSNSIADGLYSSSLGVYTTAQGDYSLSLGRGTLFQSVQYRVVASGPNSTAMGFQSSGAAGVTMRSSGENATAILLQSGDASGKNSAVIFSGEASGLSAATFLKGQASGEYSSAIFNGRASGFSSMAIMGTATGRYSTAIGQMTSAVGKYSTSLGSASMFDGVPPSERHHKLLANNSYSTAIAFCKFDERFLRSAPGALGEGSVWLQGLSGGFGGCTHNYNWTQRTGNSAEGAYSTNINSSQAGGDYSVSLTASMAKAENSVSMLLGVGEGSYSTSMVGAQSKGDHSIAMISSAYASGVNSIAIGDSIYNSEAYTFKTYGLRVEDTKVSICRYNNSCPAPDEDDTLLVTGTIRVDGQIRSRLPIEPPCSCPIGTKQCPPCAPGECICVPDPEPCPPCGAPEPDPDECYPGMIQCSDYGYPAMCAWTIQECQPFIIPPFSAISADSNMKIVTGDGYLTNGEANIVIPAEIKNASIQVYPLNNIQLRASVVGPLAEVREMKGGRSNARFHYVIRGELD